MSKSLVQSGESGDGQPRIAIQQRIWRSNNADGASVQQHGQTTRIVIVIMKAPRVLHWKWIMFSSRGSSRVHPGFHPGVIQGSSGIPGLPRDCFYCFFCDPGSLIKRLFCSWLIHYLRPCAHVLKLGQEQVSDQIPKSLNWAECTKKQNSSMNIHVWFSASRTKIVLQRIFSGKHCAIRNGARIRDC